MKKRLQLPSPINDSLLASIALNNHRLVEEKPSSLAVITPNAFSLWKRGRSTKQRAECRSRFSHPIALIDVPTGSVLARDEQHKERRCSLARLEHLGEIGHGDLRFFILKIIDFLGKKSSATLARCLTTAKDRR
jgi:hypothetical protein